MDDGWPGNNNRPVSLLPAVAKHGDIAWQHFGFVDWICIPRQNVDKSLFFTMEMPVLRVRVQHDAWHQINLRENCHKQIGAINADIDDPCFVMKWCV